MQHASSDCQNHLHHFGLYSSEISPAVFAKLFTNSQNGRAFCRNSFSQLFLVVTASLRHGFSPSRLHRRRYLFLLALQPPSECRTLFSQEYRITGLLNLDLNLRYGQWIKLKPRHFPNRAAQQPHRCAGSNDFFLITLRRRDHHQSPSSKSSCLRLRAAVPTPIAPAAPTLHHAYAPAPTPPCPPSASLLHASS